MIRWLQIGFLVLNVLCVSAVYAVRIDLSKKNKPGIKDENGFSANAVFLSFLSCATPETGKSAEKLSKCAKPYFVSSLNDDQLRSYVKLLVFPNKYSDLFYCDEQTNHLVATLEEKDFDTFLCTETNLTAPKTKTAVVFFKKTKGKPQILRIKM